MNATAAKDAIELGRDWAEADRWNGIDRDYVGKHRNLYTRRAGRLTTGRRTRCGY